MLDHLGKETAPAPRPLLQGGNLSQPLNGVYGMRVQFAQRFARAGPQRVDAVTHQERA